MSISQLTTAKEKHSIDTVRFIIEWRESLSDLQLQDFANITFTNYPHETPIQKFELYIDSEQSSRQVHELAGYRFTKSKTDLSKVLEITKERLIYADNDYESWEIFKEEIKQILDNFPKAMKEIVKTKLSMLLLQYIDVFIWKDALENLNLSEIFKEDDSEFLPKRFFSAKSYQHVHSGYVSDQDCSTQIDNINVSIERNPQTDKEHLIKISTNHMIRLSDDCIIDLINKTDSLHDDNKKTLRALLSDEVLKKIHLLD